MTKLLSIHCDNFRSLHNFNFSLQALNILIGKNDAGKSNILRAIRLLLEDDATQEVKSYDWSKLTKPKRYPRQITITGRFENAEQKFSVRRCIFLHGETVPATSVLEIDTPSGWRNITPDEREQLPSFYYLRPKTGALQESLNPMQENHLFSLTKAWMPLPLQQESGLHKLMRLYGTRQITTLKAYIKFIEDEVEPHLTRAFPSDFSKLKINPEFRGGSIRNQLLLRELEPGDQEARIRLPLDYHGTALISVVAIIFSIAVLEQFQKHFLSNKPMIIGVEEPEVHLHPQAQRGLLSYFKAISQKHQLLVTTHSPVFVDRAQPKNVTLLRRSTVKDEKPADPKTGRPAGPKAGTTVVYQKVYANNWQGVTQELGIRLSDVLMAGEIAVVVEGQTEAIILPAIAEKLQADQQPSIDFSRVVFIVGGGASLPQRVEFFQDLKIPVTAVVDNDKPGRDMKKKLEKLRNPVKYIFIPDHSTIATLPAPMNTSDDCEAEDLFDSQLLLDIFNEAFQTFAAYSFLPLTYAEYQAEQMQRKGNGKSYGWVDTVESLIRQKTSNPKAELTKHHLASHLAAHIHASSISIPDFYKNLIRVISQITTTAT